MSSNLRQKNAAALLGMMMLAMSAGCPQPTNSDSGNVSALPNKTAESHGHDDLPAIIRELAEKNTTIVNALTSSDTYADAHGALHEVGHLLEHVPHLLESSDLSDDAKQSIKDSAATLFDSYSKFDEQLHGSENEFDANALAETLKTNMAAIQQAIPAN